MLVSPVSLTYTNRTINSSFCFENSDSQSKDMMIFVAVYDDDNNMLIDFETTDITAEAGVNTYDSEPFTVTVANNQYIKAFVWNSYDEMIPYCVNELQQ